MKNSIVKNNKWLMLALALTSVASAQAEMPVVNRDYDGCARRELIYQMARYGVEVTPFFMNFTSRESDQHSADVDPSGQVLFSRTYGVVAQYSVAQHGAEHYSEDAVSKGLSGTAVITFVNHFSPDHRYLSSECGLSTATQNIVSRGGTQVAHYYVIEMYDLEASGEKGDAKIFRPLVK